MGESKRTLIKRSVLEEAKAKLKELPKAEPEKKEEISAKEAIEELRELIHEMRTEKGYTLAQVAKHLEECGIKIGSSTLQLYLRESGTRKRRRNKGSSGPGSGSTSAPAAGETSASAAPPSAAGGGKNNAAAGAK